MTVIHPCRHCPKRPSCEMRAKASAAMANGPLVVTLARLSCREYDDMFSIGERVIASIGGIYARHRFDVRGTITGQSAKKRGRWVVQVDEDDADKTGFDADEYGFGETGPRPFISVWPNRLTKLDEPLREMCTFCGNAKGPNGEHLAPKGDRSCDGTEPKF